jgi:hypothetical protein
VIYAHSWIPGYFKSNTLINGNHYEVLVNAKYLSELMLDYNVDILGGFS